MFSARACVTQTTLLTALLTGLACEKEGTSARRGPIGPEGKQIVFGDLHAHTTYSMDALMFSLEAAGGHGVSPPTKACDFARFCSQLDFWSINDHSEFLTPAYWKDTKDSIRACNALAGGNTSDPDMVSYLGWEWTQAATTAEANYGHKNVVILDTSESRVPPRPIPAPSVGVLDQATSVLTGSSVDAIVQAAIAIDPEHRSTYEFAAQFAKAAGAVPPCAEGVDTRRLPADCREYAKDPATLFEKLAQGGYTAVVIPHGSSWGLPHPPRSNWANQLNRRNHDPTLQRLIEVYSGHGNSEEYRSWEPYRVVNGINVCPEPTANYVPCCWRAGELTRQRATECVTDPTSEACAAAVKAAQEAYMSGGNRGHRQFPDFSADDWLDCGQCRDCYQPAFQYEPGSSVQAAVAATNFDDASSPLRYRFGFIGSTDEHRAAPGSGFREDRRFSDAAGPSQPKFDALAVPLLSLAVGEWERVGSFWYTGALAAVHSEGRSREAIWDALQRRETYGTSGDRILLWFYLEGPAGRVPMGSEARTSDTPRFTVTAIGAFKQNPGCSVDIKREAPDGFVDDRCFGECYNPTDQRYLIERIEVVRIRPQIRADEPVSGLIEDPWKTFPCNPNPEGCTVSFEDPDYTASGRPAAYYVRALQEKTPQVNAAGLRCTYDAKGECVAIRPCVPGHRTAGDDCLAPANERAWSSPIYLDLP